MDLPKVVNMDKRSWSPVCNLYKCPLGNSPLPVNGKLAASVHLNYTETELERKLYIKITF